MDLRILMLILASDAEPIHIEFQKSWRRYMHRNSQVECYFYKGDPNLDCESKIVDDTLWIKIQENLNNVYEKTVRAFKYFEKDLEKYDYVFRPNLSSFVAIDKYLQYCATIPKKRLVSGIIGNYNGFPYPSGCGFTMSSDVVAELVRDNPPNVYLDDVSIGKWLQTKSIPIHLAPRGDFTSGLVASCITTSPFEKLFHFRVRNPDRNLDIEIHNILFNVYYGLQTP